jgi:DNA-binding response OmpR family regulator
LLAARDPCYLLVVQKRMLVVVERDAWVHRALADGAAGFELVECSTARAGLNACCALEPDCLLAAIRLNEPEGFRLIEAIRAQPGDVSAVPIVAMAPRNQAVRQGNDDPIRVQALRAGADVVLQKPLEVVEVMAQVEALIAMTARVSSRRRRLAAADTEEPLQGDLEEAPVAGVLSMLELEQRSGELQLTTRGDPRRKLILTIASGALIGGWLGTTPLVPLLAIRAALDWEGRRFEFVPGTPQTPPASATVGELLLEALRPPTPSSARDELDDADLPTVSPRQKPPPPPVSRPGTSPAPGRRLIESVVPSSRPDPRMT